MTAKTALANSTEIHAVADDSYAPHALIGWIAETDYPAGKWIAIFPDLDDVKHDPQPVKSWVEAPSAEAAEIRVRTHYARWVAKQDAIPRPVRGIHNWF